MKHLAEKNQIAKIRFWGMIRGTVSDYYISEVDYAEFGEDALEKRDEEAQERLQKQKESAESDLDSEVFCVAQELSG